MMTKELSESAMRNDRSVPCHVSGYYVLPYKSYRRSRQWFKSCRSAISHKIDRARNSDVTIVGVALANFSAVKLFNELRDLHWFDLSK